ncbi:hypothetical protein DL98DRAFT_660757 [Cadophora sp. DSE1049]|nr:hypothetical protein DL98DRAFT_660757 [Cadophora sp. DSE1049]
MKIVIAAWIAVYSFCLCVDARRVLTDAIGNERRILTPISIISISLLTPSTISGIFHPPSPTTKPTTSTSTVFTTTTRSSTSISKTTTSTATTTALTSLPTCGQLCFNNMVAQYSALGCASPAPACLCANANFGFGIRDCANGACGTDVAVTVIAYGSAYCSSATATVPSTSTSSSRVVSSSSRAASSTSSSKVVTSSSSTTSTSTSKTSTTTSVTTKPTCTGTPSGLALASPTPAGSVCGTQANGVAQTGSGTLIQYTAGSPYVASMLACAGICTSTATCTNFFFINGTYCNLHYGPLAYVINNSGVNAFSLYTTSCFTGLVPASPVPSGAVCGVQANGVALAGTGTLINYTTGPYVLNIQACVAICIATATCTNVFFIAGSACNLHYGVNSYVVNNSGVNAYSMYDTSCFATCAVV